MADTDLELESEGASVSLAQQPVRKNISLKLKPKAEGKAKKKDRKKSEKKSNEGDKESKKKKTTSDVTTPATKLGGELFWNQQLLLIGQKVQDPLLHQCETCALPILLYGRMSPCKHAFCLACAEKANGKCPRCGELVQRIEPARLGHVFVCSFGGSRYGISGCRRSYLSQRDLHAHIKRRHQSEVPLGGGDLSAEYAADLKRDVPAYPGPISTVPMIREGLPPQPVQPDRPFPGRPPMVSDRPMVPNIPMEAYRNRAPAGNFPPNQPVVPHMTGPPGPPRMIQGDQGLMRPRFEEMPRLPLPVAQPNVRFPGHEGDVRQTWIPNDREWGHNVRSESAWIPPRSEPGPMQPHNVRPDAAQFNRTGPFY